jgi:Golgi apparatus protein 1
MQVLRCLTDKMDDIKEEACTKEVTYFEKMEVSNFRNDVILAEACRDDVDKLCATVEPGEFRL